MSGEILVQNILEDNFLSHHGIKGQKWGERRFQNEDGSLTPEGRERYGLKTGLSSMSDEDLRKAISRKQTENNYIRLQTEQARRHKENISGFIKELSNVTSQVTSKEAQNVYLKNFKKNINEDNEDLKIKRVEALKTGNKEKVKEYDEIIAKNNDSLKQLPASIDATGKISKEVGKQSDLVGSAITKKEMKEAKDRAYQNISEMDEKQLKSVVDRMLLEKEYQDLINPPKPTKIEKGREYLQTAGAILGIVLTAVTIANILKGFKTNDVVKHGEELADEYLAHYGVKGMKKGNRRYQNEDGSLTAEGYAHYGINRRDPNAKVQEVKDNYRIQKEQLKSANKLSNIQNKQQIKEQKAINKAELKKRREEIEMRRKNIMKVVVGTAAVAGIAAIGYHILKNKSLDNQLMRDLELKEVEGRQTLKQLGLEHNKKLAILEADKERRESIAKKAKETREANKKLGKTGKITISGVTKANINAGFDNVKEQLKKVKK